MLLYLSSLSLSATFFFSLSLWHPSPVWSEWSAMCGMSQQIRGEGRLWVERGLRLEPEPNRGSVMSDLRRGDDSQRDKLPTAEGCRIQQ